VVLVCWCPLRKEFKKITPFSSLKTVAIIFPTDSTLLILFILRAVVWCHFISRHLDWDSRWCTQLKQGLYLIGAMPADKCTQRGKGGKCCSIMMMPGHTQVCTPLRQSQNLDRQCYHTLCAVLTSRHYISTSLILLTFINRTGCHCPFKCKFLQTRG